MIYFDAEHINQQNWQYEEHVAGHDQVPWSFPLGIFSRATPMVIGRIASLCVIINVAKIVVPVSDEAQQGAMAECRPAST